MNAGIILLGATTLPPFDWNAAIIVGVIVVAGAAIILTAGIATPFIGIAAGATIQSTIVAVVGIAVVTGVVAGTAAGFYRGHENEIRGKVEETRYLTRRKEQLKEVAKVISQLDIYFDPTSEDPTRAAAFQCSIVRYEGTDLKTTPTISEVPVHIVAQTSDDFFQQVDRQIMTWSTKRPDADLEKTSRSVMIYMKPYPGEGVYEHFKTSADQKDLIVNRIEGEWISAIPPQRLP